MLDPPQFYGIVEKGIYRSDMITSGNFPFVQSLELKAMLILSPEKPSRQLRTFAEENNIKIVHLGLHAWRHEQDWKPVSSDLIVHGIRVLLDATNHPILVMDSEGNLTGTLFAVFRRFERWNFSSAMAEYRKFAGPKARYVNELFVELFDIKKLTLPEHLPGWWLEQEGFWQVEEDS